MVYSKKFVAVLKVDGRILREFNHENISEFESECSLLLPFGAEYSLLFKNLEARDALLNVEIDGEDVLGGNSIVVRAGGSVELDGFMNKDGRVKNKFKFIQKTEQIVQHRGDRIDDGMIRIEWTYEKPKPIKVDTHINEYHNKYWNDWHWVKTLPCNPWYPYTPTVTYGATLGGSVSSCGNVSSCADRVQLSNTGSFDGDVIVAACGPAPDEGITVKGSEANQIFNNAYIGELEENSHVIVIRLKGTFKSTKVSKPIEVKTRIQCPTCGSSVKSGNKFCPNCGTCCVDI